jgi:hypothetical protein
MLCVTVSKRTHSVCAGAECRSRDSRGFSRVVGRDEFLGEKDDCGSRGEVEVDVC